MLAELQKNFASYIFGQDSESVLSEITDYGLRPDERMNVYRNHTRLTLRTLLSAAYPVVGKYLGEDDFAVSAADYFSHYPLVSPEAISLGNCFPDYLQSNKNTVVADIARLERSAKVCFHAGETESISVAQKLASLSPEALGAAEIKLSPDCALLECSVQAFHLWKNKGSSGGCHYQGSITVLMKRHVSGEIQTEEISTGDYTFYDCLCRGDNLLAASEMAAEADKNFDFSRAYAAGIQQQLFASVKTEKTE